MRIVDEYEYRIPARYLSALINEDYSGLLDFDETCLNKFLDRVSAEVGEGKYGMWVLPDDCDPFFSWNNDVHNLGDDCYDVKFITFKT